MQPIATPSGGGAVSLTNSLKLKPSKIGKSLETEKLLNRNVNLCFQLLFGVAGWGLVDRYVEYHNKNDLSHYFIEDWNPVLQQGRAFKIFL